MNDKFDKPLNKWIEEEVEVDTIKPVVNEAKNRIELKRVKQKATQRTLYSNKPTRRVVCTKHVYACVNKGKYIFKCKKCDWYRIAPPITFKFDQNTGILS